jgi:hypothetical protein
MLSYTDTAQFRDAVKPSPFRRGNDGRPALNYAA